MAREIERKYLVRGGEWRGLAAGAPFRQGYLSTHEDRSVRVRVVGDRGYLTIKGRSRGAVRSEFEYEVPLADAQAMLDELCARPLIEKTRYRVPIAGLVWEIDEFAGDNAGLVVAEVELPDEGREVTKPDWVGEEVTDDPRYYNANLVANPFSTWRKEEES